MCIDIKTELLKLFDSNIDNKYYLNSLGFNTNVPVYNKFTHLNAKVLFRILDSFDLNYYVFAGTSVGYIRDKKNIPWVDDYDIIVFENDIYNFENLILPTLEKLGFDCFKAPYGKDCGYQMFSRLDQKCFQCDVFFTFVDQNNFIKNKARQWGLYNYKNVSINIVKPKQYLTIDDDLMLPFFNNISKDIEIEYGDVFNKCVFNINHQSKLSIDANFNDVYNVFNEVKQSIIDNTFTLFSKHEYLNNVTLDNFENFLKSENMVTSNKFEEVLAFLKYVNKSKIKNLYIMDQNFLFYCIDLKFYFKDINIYFYMTNELDNKNIILLNYINKIFCSKKEYINYINDCNIMFLNKPTVELIKVITFGTYDLFHIGHINILKRAYKYGNLVVGVSTDELNAKKGKTSINKLEKRKSDVYNSNYADIVFDEESLEFKNDYIKKYNCNLLIMGDDWKDAFNFCDCACLYLPRTPNISTTLLKENLLTKI